MSVRVEAYATAILLRRIKWLTAFFIFGLVMSGVTAIPLEAELKYMCMWLMGGMDNPGHGPEVLREWLLRIYTTLHHVFKEYPFLLYGTDWLAFGHFAIALAFVGAWREPVRNRWLFDFGLMACALIIPYAVIFGAVRGIPWWWRLIDCSFGIFGAVPLLLCRKYVEIIERAGDREQ